MQTGEKDNYDWLIGDWIREDKGVEKLTYESWQKTSDQLYNGHGYVMVANDTTWQERMTFSKSDRGWILEVVTPGNDDMVSFSLTNSSDTSFTVENVNHDFPQLIKYWIVEDMLMAEVVGGNDQLSFIFRKR